MKTTHKNIVNAIKGDKTLAKHIYQYVWTSGSSTEVHPITLWSREVSVQLDTNRRMFDKTIERILKAYPDLFKDGYFCKNDGSCPAEIRFTYTDETRQALENPDVLQVGTMVRMPGVRGGLRVEEIDRKGDRVICKSEGEKHEYKSIAYFVAKAEEIRIPEWLRIGKYFHIGSAFGHERVLCTAIEPNNDPEHPVIIRWAAGNEESSIVLTSALDEDNQEKVA